MVDNVLTSAIKVDIIGGQGVANFQKTVADADRQLRNLKNTANSTKSITFLGGNATHRIQNASYQIQDFAVQVASGTDAMRAASQQAPQFLSAFGPWGTVIGTAAAVLLPLAGYLFDSVRAAKEYSDAIKAAGDATTETWERIAQLRGVNLTEVRLQTQITLQNERLALLKEELAAAQALTREERTHGPNMEMALQNAEGTAAARVKELNAQIQIGQQKLRDLELSLKQVAAAEREASMAQQLYEARRILAEQAKKEAEYRSNLAELSKQVAAADRIVAQYGTEGLAVYRDQLEAKKQIEELTSRIASETGLSQKEARKLAVEHYNVAEQQKRQFDFMEAINREISAAARAARAWGELMASVNQIILRIKMSLADAVNLMGRFGSVFSSVISQSAVGQVGGGLFAGLQNILNSDGAKAAVELFKEIGTNAYAASQGVLKLDEAITEGASGGGVGSGASDSGFKDFLQSLERYRTDAEEAEAAMALLKVGFAKFGDQLNPEQVKSYNRAIAELTETAKGTAEELGEFGSIIQNSLTGAMDRIIDRTSSVKDAFSDMLSGMLADLAKFMVNRNLQYFFQLLANSGGFGGYVFGQGGINTAGFPPAPPPAPPPGGGPIIMPPAPAPTVTRIGRANPGSVPAASMAGRSNVNVNVYNENGSQVEVQETRNDNGGMDIDLYIKNRIRTELSSGALDRMLNANYGVRRRPG